MNRRNHQRIRTCLCLLALLAFSSAGALATPCLTTVVSGVEECGGGYYTFTACAEEVPETGALVIRIYDDGCSYDVTA